MRYEWIGRFFFWLAVLGVLALALALGTQFGLEAAGASRTDAIIVSSALAVAIALSAADVFTPIGRREVREHFEADPAAMLPDFAIAGVVGAIVAGLARLLGGIGMPFVGQRAIAVILGVTVGYLAFVAQNRELYRQRAGEA